MGKRFDFPTNLKAMLTRYNWRKLQYFALFFVFAPLLAGCSAIQNLASLRNVDFSLDRISQLHLASVDVLGLQQYTDLSTLDGLKLAAALAKRDLPLEMTIDVGALNPSENSVDAKMVRMDWTLFLEDRETVSGTIADAIPLPVGQKTTIPVDISLDLIEFFDGNLTDLVELAMSLAGQGGSPKNVKLEALPTIDTAIGPIRYPSRITIVNEDIG